MEDSRSVSDRPGWDAVHIEDASRHLARIRPKRGAWIGTAILIAGAIAGHGAIGYFGFKWMRDNQAPSFSPAETARPIEPTATTTKRDLTEIDPSERLPTESGNLRWTRRDGLHTKPVMPAIVEAAEGLRNETSKCIGGVVYTTSIAKDGSTVIEIARHNGQNLRCWSN